MSKKDLDVPSVLLSIENRIDVLFDSKIELPPMLYLAMTEMKSEVFNYLQKEVRA